MKKIGLLWFTLLGLIITLEEVQAQQSAPEFNFEVEERENSDKSRLIVDKAFKKANFDEIEIEYLPQVLKDIIVEDFEGATPKKAYVKKKDGINLYKVELEIEGETKDFYSDINGNWTDQDGLEYI